MTTICSHKKKKNYCLQKNFILLCASRIIKQYTVDKLEETHAANMQQIT